MFSTVIESQGTFVFLLFITTWFSLVIMLSFIITLVYVSYYVVASYIHLVNTDLKLSFKKSIRNCAPVEMTTNIERYTHLLRVSFINQILKSFKNSRNSAGENETAFVDWMNKIKQSQQMFVYLCTALMELNKVYSLPVFIFVLLRLISSSVCLYESVYIWISGNEFLEKLIPAMSTYWFVGFFNISIIACAADSPINEVKAIKLVLLTQSCFTTLYFSNF